MDESPEQPRSDDRDAFLREAGEKRVGLLTEFWDFLKHNKKWWLIPILVAMLGLAALALLSSSSGALAPFVYPLF